MDVSRGSRQGLGARQGGRDVADNLYKRGKIWWGRIQIGGKELRRSLRTDLRSEARKRFTDWETELKRAQYYGHARLTWQDAVVRYCQEVMPGAIKPSTA